MGRDKGSNHPQKAGSMTTLALRPALKPACILWCLIVDPESRFPQPGHGKLIVGFNEIRHTGTVGHKKGADKQVTAARADSGHMGLASDLRAHLWSRGWAVGGAKCQI